MPGMSLIGHEWRVHGTCTGLDQASYFRLVRKAREAVRVPSEFKPAAPARSIDPARVEAAFIAANPGIGRDGIAVTCRDRRIEEVRICLTKSLRFRSCPHVHAAACDRPRASTPRPAAATEPSDRSRKTRIPVKILFSPASPYSSKVRMAARYSGLDLEEPTDTSAEGAQLVGHNPLGKIPTLITEADHAVYDSRAIMQFIDRTAGRKLYPRNVARRTEAEVLEALCDGICDALLLIVYERRYRPEEKVHQDWIDRQWRRVERPRSPERQPAAHDEVAARRPLRARRASRLSGPALRGKMGARPGEAQELAGEVREGLSGLREAQAAGVTSAGRPAIRQAPGASPPSGRQRCPASLRVVPAALRARHPCSCGSVIGQSTM